MKYEVVFIVNRCFLQKRLNLDSDVEIIPLSPTSMRGEIHNIKQLLKQKNYRFTRKDFENHTENFSKSGQSVLIKFPPIEAPIYPAAIEYLEGEAEAIMGALAVVSANPVVSYCAYAKSSRDYGLKYYFPNDRIIRHGTNIHGFLDIFPDLAKAAKNDKKLSLLLRLYRASLREPEIDNQILFQLILLEEASDSSTGKSLAERLRNFFIGNNIIGDLNAIAEQLEYELPDNKDMVDVLVKLRNATAHNGIIDKKTLQIVQIFPNEEYVRLKKSKKIIVRKGSTARVIYPGEIKKPKR